MGHKTLVVYVGPLDHCTQHCELLSSRVRSASCMYKLCSLGALVPASHMQLKLQPLNACRWVCAAGRQEPGQQATPNISPSTGPSAAGACCVDRPAHCGKYCLLFSCHQAAATPFPFSTHCLVHVRLLPVVPLLVASACASAVLAPIMPCVLVMLLIDRTLCLLVCWCVLPPSRERHHMDRLSGWVVRVDIALVPVQALCWTVSLDLDACRQAPSLPPCGSRVPPLPSRLHAVMQPPSSSRELCWAGMLQLFVETVSVCFRCYLMVCLVVVLSVC